MVTPFIQIPPKINEFKKIYGMDYGVHDNFRFSEKEFRVLVRSGLTETIVYRNPCVIRVIDEASLREQGA